jgi:hypothetical protein
MLGQEFKWTQTRELALKMTTNEVELSGADLWDVSSDHTANPCTTSLVQ